MPSIFSSSSREHTNVKYFEIRLDESNIILRGSEDEAPSALLKGTLVLCLSEPLQVKGIRLRFTGEKRVAWHQPSSSGSNYVKHDETFTRKQWDFKRMPETMPAGNYEWPFDMIVSGSTPESLEGLTDTWIIYRMKATIERGVLQSNFTARRQVRIIRSLDPTALELAHSMAVENLWPNKIEYSLSTPMKAVIFGSYICVNFKLIPHLKGLKIGKVITELVEKQELHMSGPKIMTRSRQIIRHIHKDEYSIPDDAEAEEVEGQDGYQFARSIPVPQSLRKCVQTVDALGVKIRHSLMFNIQLHNPDGHISELHATLPVFIFLSPNLPIDENNNLVDHTRGRALSAIGLNDLTPPQYGEHQFDQLYSEIDPSGYVTPGGPLSGLSTPLQTRSRSVSAENLNSVDAMATSGIPVSVLQSRLNSLNAAGAGAAPPLRDRSNLPRLMVGAGERNNTLAGQGEESVRERHASISPNEYFPRQESSSNGPNTGGETSRRPSEEDEINSPGTQVPRHVEYSVEDLVKVPSYTTALRSNPRTPISEGLPSYYTAIQAQLPSPPCRTGSEIPRNILQVGRGSI